jgi:hypothetical protein
LTNCGNGSEVADRYAQNHLREHPKEEALPNSPNISAATVVERASSSDQSLRCEGVNFAAKLFLPSTDAEIDCVVSALSPHGARIEGAPFPPRGSDVVLYVEGFDRFSAFVETVSGASANLSFTCSDKKRLTTAERIRSFLAGEPLPQTFARSTTRAALPAVRQFGRGNGQIAEFEVIDVSLAGALLRTRCRPEIGETITIGNSQGRVTRHVPGGIAVEFIRRRRRA